MDLESTEEEDLAKKRTNWHFEWLETLISYYGTTGNQPQDSVYDLTRPGLFGMYTGTCRFKRHRAFRTRCRCTRLATVARLPSAATHRAPSRDARCEI